MASQLGENETQLMKKPAAGVMAKAAKMAAAGSGGGENEK
jgi:hypothetical protein